VNDSNRSRQSNDGDSKGKLSLQAAWAMAVGGMIGGGIFSVLGVVVEHAGRWAWASFLVGGLIALCTGVSYSKLAVKYGESGGAFTFLRHEKLDSFAGSVSWMLVGGYVLTISVYAFTFGHYLAHVMGGGVWLPRIAAGVAVASMVAINLRGVGQSAITEILAVWGKLIILIGLAAIGLWAFDAGQLSPSTEHVGFGGLVMGAAAVFMAYEGFQLLSYDYDDMREPAKTLPRATTLAIVTVIVVYIVVTLGATSLVGADALIEQKEVALARAGEVAMGAAGKWLVSIAAGLSTLSAINATLFATARLCRTIANDGEMPAVAAKENRFGVPDRAVIALGVLGGSLAMIGNLGSLVEAASLCFLVVFAIVNGLAAKHKAGPRAVSVAGCLGAASAAALLSYRIAVDEPMSLVGIGGLLVLATAGRALVLKMSGTHRHGS
jgi:amino acid transporter